MPEQPKRRLAAIMFTDIVGYSALMQADEEQGILFRNRHKSIFDACTEQFNGEILQYYGDGTLSIFDSAVSAVECAIALQQKLQTDPVIPVRIGIHLGDIHYDKTEVFGHGVNVAARIEPVCNPGGIFISGKVFDEIKNHSGLSAELLGAFPFKNIETPVEIYAVRAHGVVFPSKSDITFIHERSKVVNISQPAVKSGAFRDLENGSAKKKSRSLRLSLYTVSGLAIIALVLFSLQFFPGQKPIPTNESVSIAVLPFLNMSDSDENEYFSDGITEDILTLLSKVDNFKVTSRTSVMQYKDTEKSMRDIGEELKVDHLLEGSVRRHGDRVRINAQLIKAETDEHIWAHTYDEELTDIFAIQSQVARDITEKLKQNLTTTDRAILAKNPTQNIQAYDLYLKGREKYRHYSRPANDTAIILFKRALEMDPNYAYAYAGLGDAYGQKAHRYTHEKSQLDSAIYYSNKAIELDPTLSEGYKALGLAYHYKGELDRALEYYEKAIALNNGNDMAAHNIGQIQKQKGNYGEAVRWAHRTYEINRNVQGSIIMLAATYKDIGLLDKAMDIINEGLERHPGHMEYNIIRSEILIDQGYYNQALEILNNLNPQDKAAFVIEAIKGHLYSYKGEWESAVEHYEAMVGKEQIKHFPVEELIGKTLLEFSRKKRDKDSYNEKLLRTLLDQVNGYVRKASTTEFYETGLLKATLLAMLKENDEACEILDEICNPVCPSYLFLKNHPISEELNKSKRFREIIQESDARLEEIRNMAETFGSQVVI